MSTRVSVLAALAATLLCSACASAPKYPILGDWLVTSYTSPGASVPPLSQLTLVGTSASLETGSLRFGLTRCAKPTYTAKPLTAAEFADQYKTPASSLELTGDRIETYELSCDDGGTGPPRVVIVKSADRLLVPWEGTFYELSKRPSQY